MHGNDYAQEPASKIHRNETPHSNDPFGIYELLQQKKENMPQSNDFGPTHPPGFTPNIYNKNNGEGTNSSKNKEKSNTSKKSFTRHNVEALSQRANNILTDRGLILDVMDNLVQDPNLFHKEHVSSSDYFLAVMGTWIPSSTKLLVISMWDGETVILGNFNKVRLNHERFGSSFNIQGANAFNNFISMACLFDLPLGGYSYTWTHKSASKMSKLDHFYRN
ncbi:hypothetical protein Tco_1262918 [Tanacetum coccineum]